MLLPHPEAAVAAAAAAVLWGFVQSSDAGCALLHGMRWLQLLLQPPYLLQQKPPKSRLPL
jgi:hypothetical protein